MNKSQANITTIRDTMSTGTTFHLQRGEVIYRILTLNTDGSGAIRTNDVNSYTPTWFTDKELATLAKLAKGWDYV